MTAEAILRHSLTPRHDVRREKSISVIPDHVGARGQKTRRSGVTINAVRFLTVNSRLLPLLGLLWMAGSTVERAGVGVPHDSQQTNAPRKENDHSHTNPRTFRQQIFLHGKRFGHVTSLFATGAHEKHHRMQRVFEHV